MSITVNAEVREVRGKGASRRLRKEEKVPSIVYGGSKAPLMISLNIHEITHLLENEDTFTSVLDLVVDKSKESVNQARSRFSKSSIFHTLHSENWKDIQYDLIFSAGVFHHIPHDEHKNLLKNLSALLKPGGKVAIWEHNPLNPFTKKIVNDCIFDQDAVLIHPHWMKKDMRETPLSNIQVTYTTFFPKALAYLNVLDPYLGWFPLGGQFVITGEKI